MIENIVFLAIIGLAITEVIFIVGLLILNAKISKLKGLENDYEFIRTIQKDNNSIIKRMCDAVDEERETYEHMYELMDTISESYAKIYAQYDEIKGQYEVVCANYNHLLKCWDEVAQNYSATFEQFKLLSDEVKKINDMKDMIKTILDPWTIDSDQMGEQIVNGTYGIKYTYNANYPDLEAYALKEDDENPFIEKTENSA